MAAKRRHRFNASSLTRPCERCGLPYMHRGHLPTPAEHLIPRSPAKVRTDAEIRILTQRRKYRNV